MQQILENGANFFNDKRVDTNKIETLHKKMIYKLVEEKAEVEARMLSEERYAIEIIIRGFKFLGEYEMRKSEKQVMDNALKAIEEFIIA